MIIGVIIAYVWHRRDNYRDLRPDRRTSTVEPARLRLRSRRAESVTASMS